jgi:gamma-glutamyltranspeptidase / glutathione hydrolase
MSIPLYPFASRRSNVIAQRGMVATSQPLAAMAGLQVLQQGGNAVDAAVATAVALNVVEPMSTGIGGDLFALVWMAKEGKLRALNASGRSPYAATIDRIKGMGQESMPETGMLAVTVPGALSGWDTLVRTCGRLSLEQVMAPAIHYAGVGFPVSELIAGGWSRSVARLNTHPATAANYLVDGRPPAIGEVFRQPDLARTLRAVAQGGAEAFYRGEIAERIVAFSQANGGLFALEDFADHTPTWVDPISTEYHGVWLHECPPNGQGIVALMALNILKGFDLHELGHNSPRYLHVVIEALKLAFADAHLHVTDPEQYAMPVEQMLSDEYAAQRRKEIDINKANPNPVSGIGVVGDTVYLSAADGEGNVVSLINSLYNGFGSGMVVEGTGICLQNRGYSFKLDPAHPNRVEPHKRPYHTIIPAMVTAGDGRPLYSYGVMGGHMQPQGHVQVLINMVDMGMLPQQALDNPRVQWLEGSKVLAEPSFGDECRNVLIAMGHEVASYDEVSPSQFGGGQVIRIDPETGVLMAGTEPRKDGLAIGY